LRPAYQSDAIVLTCFDARFDGITRRLCRRLRLERPDLIRVAGGPLALASGRMEERWYVLSQLTIAHELHRAPCIILVGHTDCGYNGGMSHFDNDPEREFVASEQTIEDAMSAVTARFPDLDAFWAFANFDGVWMGSSAVSGESAVVRRRNECIERSAAIWRNRERRAERSRVGAPGSVI
jgi:hypothetical protein